MPEYVIAESLTVNNAEQAVYGYTLRQTDEADGAATVNVRHWEVVNVKDAFDAAVKKSRAAYKKARQPARSGSAAGGEENEVDEASGALEELFPPGTSSEEDDTDDTDDTDDADDDFYDAVPPSPAAAPAPPEPDQSPQQSASSGVWSWLTS